MRRVRIGAAIICSLGLLFFGAPAASTPIGLGDQADRSYDGEGTLAIYRADGTFLRWVEGPWTQDMDDFHWPSIDWAPRPLARR